MRRLSSLSLGLALCAALGAGAAYAKAAPRIARTRVVLSADAAFGATGKVEVQHRRATRKAGESDALLLRMQHLVRGETYTVWCLDPIGGSPVAERIPPWEGVVAARNRTAVVRFDTAKGDSLPFGATLTQLAGCKMQIRDSLGHTVLTGQIPALPAK